MTRAFKADSLIIMESIKKREQNLRIGIIPNVRGNTPWLQTNHE